jgi:hypothetical protein
MASNVVAIIQELKELKLRKIEVLEALERIHTSTQEDTDPPITARNIPTTRTTKTSETQVFKVSDQVVMTNKVLCPLNRQPNKGDRTAIVTKVDKQRIDIKTSNGT